MQVIDEADWKVFRDLKPIALDRFCARILGEADDILAQPETSPHQRYLALYRHIHDRDKDVANIFNDFKRSTATWHILLICQAGLLQEEEMARFTPHLRQMIADTLAEQTRRRAAEEKRAARAKKRNSNGEG